MQTQVNTIPAEVTPEELQACRNDPAWEARRDIADRIVCRVCGAAPKYPFSGKKGHLWVRHRMSTQDYRAAYPGARLVSFRVVARNAIGRLGRCSNARELMASFADHYVTPKELELYRRDPCRETSLRISDFVVCRVCGAKIKTTLSGSSHDHLHAEHGLDLQSYRALWPDAPRGSADNAKAVSKASQQWAKSHPNEVKAIQARHYKQPKTRQRLRTYSEKYRRDVRAFAKMGKRFPSDWFDRPVDSRVIGQELLSTEDYMSNLQLAQRLLEGNLINLSKYGNGAKEISAHRAFVKRVNEVRNWVDRPGKVRAPE